MKRTPIKKVVGRKIAMVRLTNDRQFFILVDAKGKTICLIGCDHLFDADGMFFDTEEIE